MKIYFFTCSFVSWLAKYAELLSHFEYFQSLVHSWNIFTTLANILKVDHPTFLILQTVVRRMASSEGEKWTRSEHFNQIIWIHNPKSNFKMYNIFYSIDKIRIILQFSVSIKSTCIHIFPLSAASLYHYLFPDPDSLV